MKKTTYFLIVILVAAFGVRLIAAIAWDRRVRQKSEVAATGGDSSETGLGGRIPSNFSSESDELLADEPLSDRLSSDEALAGGLLANGPLSNEPLPDGPFFFGDSDSYWKLGRAMALGRPYCFDTVRRWSIFRMPGYPAILAPLFWLGGEHPPVFWGRVENVFFGVGTVWMTFFLGAMLFGDSRVGLLAALFAAFDPALIFQSVQVLSEESFAFFLLLQLLVLTAIFRDAPPSVLSPNCSPKEVKAARMQRSFALGIALGLSSAATVYLRPGWLDFIPFVAVILAILYGVTKLFRYPFFRVEGAAIFLTAAFGFILFCLALAPWWLRNERLTGEFVATTLQSGASLYDGLSPTADGSSRMEFVDPFRAEVLAEPLPFGRRAHFEVRLDQRLRDESLAWAKSHPREVVRLAVVKFFRLWNFWPNEPSFRAFPIRLVVAVTYGPILIFGILGGIMTFRRGVRYWFLWLPALYISALHSIFVASLRYRVPVMPGLMILAAFAILTMITPRRNRSVKG